MIDFRKWSSVRASLCAQNPDCDAWRAPPVVVGTLELGTFFAQAVAPNRGWISLEWLKPETDVYVRNLKNGAPPGIFRWATTIEWIDWPGVYLGPPWMQWKLG